MFQTTNQESHSVPYASCGICWCISYLLKIKPSIHLQKIKVSWGYSKYTGTNNINLYIIQQISSDSHSTIAVFKCWNSKIGFLIIRSSYIYGEYMVNILFNLESFWSYQLINSSTFPWRNPPPADPARRQDLPCFFCARKSRLKITVQAETMRSFSGVTDKQTANS